MLSQVQDNNKQNVTTDLLLQMYIANAHQANMQDRAAPGRCRQLKMQALLSM
jgi:hypothetical protein